MAQPNRNTMLDNQFTKVPSPATSANPSYGINLEFLWIATELAQQPAIDWTVKPLIALVGTAAEKTTGYRGLVATDRELAKFLQLSSPRQVQKAIQRGISSGLLFREQLKQRLLSASISRLYTTGIKIPRTIIESSSLPWPKKALYSLIAGIAKGRKHQCFASNAWLGKALGLSPCYVRELIGEFVQAGMIEAQYGQRSRYLWVNHDSVSPKVVVKPPTSMAREAAPDSPEAATIPLSHSPTTAPIRINILKESEEISPATPENLLFVGKELQSSESTLSTNLADETLTPLPITTIQTAGSLTTSTIPTTTLESQWDPKTNFEWQFEQLLRVVSRGYSAMQRSQVIPRSKNLRLDEKLFREFCLTQFPEGLVEMNPDYRRLNFTPAVGEFLWMLFLSWFGMSQIGQANPRSPKKYDVWLITKNTHDLTKFLQRYPKICRQLKKQTEFDAKISGITGPVSEQVLRSWWRHNWSRWWNPKGNVLLAKIPQEILDPRCLENARMEFNRNLDYALSQHRANPQKPIPELLHEGATQSNPYWSSTFAWLLLHMYGFQQEAKQYEVEVLEGFKWAPEALQLYRERAPHVMKKICESILSPSRDAGVPK